MISFFIKTLGCKVNQYEEQLIRENMVCSGIFKECIESPPGIIIINSCTVTNQADKKTCQLIRKFHREYPEAKLIVTGCYAVFDKDVETIMSIPGVFAVIKGTNKDKFVEILAEKLDLEKTTICSNEIVTGFKSHTRAFLKIQDGCVQKCSYCKVPLVRSSLYSKHEDLIVEEIEGLIKNGYREIVLTGICLGAWRGEKIKALNGLIGKIDTINGDFRVRLSSIEPNHIDEQLIEALAASEKICKHLHISLQSGSDKVLKNMNRRYDTKDFLKVIYDVRSKIPSIGVTMDVITGFPGESESDQEETEEFLKKIEPSRLHVFSYSDREGTKAYDMDNKINNKDVKLRTGRLIDIGKLLEDKFCSKFIGKEIEILVEKGKIDSPFNGYSSEYAQVCVKKPEKYFGKIIKAISREKVTDSPILIV